MLPNLQARIGQNAWLSASRKFIALHSLANIVGFEIGRCYGAGMISQRVFEEVRWPDLSWCEDQKQFDALRKHPTLGALVLEADDLLYVHRRHDSNASLAHRHSLWQGVLPLQLAGAEALAAAELVKQLLAQPHPEYLEGGVAASKIQSIVAEQSSTYP
uniref:Uncharacterized protein n=1 Tax=Haptolina ericina TaxID=156174 RepID=A0A7S3B012_9EUKA|mmetsp:Transcript_42030/g.94967  ORF Transcript_42030/g.94967 Transcript_42030/m.94967 type:complete len:159 (+) Transcript_42030:44-520(+)